MKHMSIIVAALLITAVCSATTIDLSNLSDAKKTEITRLAIDFTTEVNRIIYSDGVYVDLQCEAPGFIEYAVDPEFRHHNMYFEDGQEYDIVCDGVRRETYNIWMASNKMLGFRAYPNTGDDRDRVELVLSSLHADNALVYGSVKTLSYDLLIPGGDDPTDWLIFTQVWQQDCAEKVPFTIWFKPGTLDYELYARTPDSSVKFGEGTLRRGLTTHFEYEFYPAIDGHIKVRIGDMYHEFNGAWGSEFSGSFEIRVGIYGGNQDVDTLLYFKDIKLGSIN